MQRSSQSYRSGPRAISAFPVRRTWQSWTQSEVGPRTLQKTHSIVNLQGSTTVCMTIWRGHHQQHFRLHRARSAKGMCPYHKPRGYVTMLTVSSCLDTFTLHFQPPCTVASTPKCRSNTSSPLSPKWQPSSSASWLQQLASVASSNPTTSQPLSVFPRRNLRRGWVNMAQIPSLKRIQNDQ